jgi:hypothetical protein
MSISFTLAGIDRTINSEWFTGADAGSTVQSAMKTALRKGGVADLNVYTTSFTNIGLLGFATFPSSYLSNPNEDGVVIRYTTLPGGTEDNHGLG